VSLVNAYSSDSSLSSESYFLSIIYRRPRGDVNRRNKRRQGGVFRPVDWVKADGNKAHGWLYSLAFRALDVFAKEPPDDERLA